MQLSQSCRCCGEIGDFTQERNKMLFIPYLSLTNLILSKRDMSSFFIQTIYVTFFLKVLFSEYKLPWKFQEIFIKLFFFFLISSYNCGCRYLKISKWKACILSFSSFWKSWRNILFSWSIECILIHWLYNCGLLLLKVIIILYHLY